MKWNEKVAEVARQHSKEMADNNYFMHEGLDCSDADDRISRAEIFHTMSGENIMQMPMIKQYWYTPSSYSPYSGGSIEKRDYKTFDELVTDTVEGWMNSPGYRANILTADFDETGIGVVIQNVPKERVENTNLVPIITIVPIGGVSCARASTPDKEATFYITQDFISTECGSGATLCNGKCWENCGSGSEFQCTSSGGTCIPIGQQGCEPDGIYCNGQC